MGVVSAAGTGVEPFWDAVSSGSTPLVNWEGKIGSVETQSPAIPASHFDGNDHMRKRQLRLFDKVSQYAVVAAREAVNNANLDLSSVDPSRVAVVIATAAGGELTRETAVHSIYVEHTGVSPMTIPRGMSSAPASAVAIEFGATGPTLCTSTACASSAHAIAVAELLIKSGAADVVITGGTETLPSIGLWKAWQGLGVLGHDTIRPFSLERSGFVFGEGAGILVLESERFAAGRGANIQAVLAGTGSSSDAKDMVNPDPEGMAAAVYRALEDAGLTPADVNYVNAHGTGTKANDASETTALKSVFGKRMSNLPVSSTKSVHGHAMGASSALELIATVKAINESKVPPTANFLTPDPEIEIDCVPNEARAASIEVAVSNSFAFGGLNVCLVVTA